MYFVDRSYQLEKRKIAKKYYQRKSIWFGFATQNIFDASIKGKSQVASVMWETFTPRYDMPAMRLDGDDLFVIVIESQSEKVFKKNAAVARFVLVFPARAAPVPVFERLLQVKLDGVDQLSLVAFDHHLVAA